MEWTAQQERALTAVDRWFAERDGPQVFRLFGFAGTGKTTLARHFSEGIDGTTLFGAYTGKAALVMRRAGCPEATTMHAHIYHGRDRSRARLLQLEEQITKLRAELIEEGCPDVENHQRVRDIRAMIERERTEISKPAFTLNPESALRGAKLLTIDECSMIDARMGEDILSFGTKVLVLGDPFQLPPVVGAGFFTDREPDIMLTDIRRQAKDNPIIDMATRVREGDGLPLGKYGDSEVTERRLGPEEVVQADQVLVGRNKTRRACNNRLRTLKGHHDELPVPGDKLVCLRNNHELGLLNGAIWWCEDRGVLSNDRIVMRVRSDEETSETLDLEAHSHYFQGRGEDMPWWDRREAEEFDYGDALTVHKSQGSQFGTGVVFDESWCFREDRAKWLYTGITRFIDQVTVART